MKNHPATLNVQLAASACVFNLTKQDLAAGMPVRLLSTVTQLLLEAMRTFPNHQQVASCCSGVHPYMPHPAGRKQERLHSVSHDAVNQHREHKTLFCF